MDFLSFLRILLYICFCFNKTFISGLTLLLFLCIKLKFAVADIPVDCILGNIFLVAVEPHGSFRTKKDKGGYFITLPTSSNGPRKIKLPYVSAPRVSTMVQTMEELKKA